MNNCLILHICLNKLKKRSQNHNDCPLWTMCWKLRSLDGGVHINNLSLTRHNVEDWWRSDLEMRLATLIKNTWACQILKNILSIVAQLGKHIHNRNGFMIHPCLGNGSNKLVHLRGAATRNHQVVNFKSKLYPDSWIHTLEEISTQNGPFNSN